MATITERNPSKCRHLVLPPSGVLPSALGGPRPPAGYAGSQCGQSRLTGGGDTYPPPCLSTAIDNQHSKALPKKRCRLRRRTWASPTASLPSRSVGALIRHTSRLRCRHFVPTAYKVAGTGGLAHVIIYPLRDRCHGEEKRRKEGKKRMRRRQRRRPTSAAACLRLCFGVLFVEYNKNGEEVAQPPLYCHCF